MYDYLELNQPEFYNDANKLVFNRRVFTIAVDACNVSAIDSLINKGYDYFISANESIQPILYNILFKHTTNNILFDYFFALHKALDVDTLNAIPGIKMLPSVVSYNKHFSDFLLKIFELPIDFKNMDKVIIEMFKPIYNCQLGFVYTRYDTSHFASWDIICSTIYLVFKTGKIQNNPFINLVLDTDTIETYYKNLDTKFKKPEDANLINRYKRYIKYFQYLCSQFNWEAPPNLKTTFDKFYTKEELESYQADKNIFIAQLEESLSPIKKTKKVAKSKTRKTKPIVQSDQSDSDDNIDV
jgi:hypothetical protein